MADALESSRNSGYWLWSSQPDFFTNDGLHPAPGGHDRVVECGVIDTSKIQSFNEGSPRPSSLFSATSLGNTGTFVSPAVLRRVLGMDRVSFTPIVEGADVAGTCTYIVQAAEAIKVGRLVHFLMLVRWTNRTGDGQILIKGLPWKQALSNQPLAISSGNLMYPDNFTIVPRLVSREDYVAIWQNGPSLSPGPLKIDNNRGNCLLDISGSYIAANDPNLLW